jgi:hypothetical protein
MRRITADGGTFSFTYMTYNSTTGKSDGIVHVQRAKLLQREDKKYNKNAEDQERYMNMDTKEPRRFWHPLLMDFNGERVTL